MCEADVLFEHKNYCIHVVFSIQVKDDAIVRILKNKQCCTSLFINLSAGYLDAATIYNYKYFPLTFQFLTIAVTTMLHWDQT